MADLEDLSSIDVVELVMALEDAFPTLALPETADPQELLRFLRDRMDEDPDGTVAALVRRKGPQGRGGATASAVPE